MKVIPAQGSPPRMRGKAACCGIAKAKLGITPAYAGKRISIDNHGGCAVDHPRVCGEKPRTSRLGLRCLGSPPRMRGKAGEKLSAEVDHRITPAYAGKSMGSNSGPSCPQDHPRVCGEKYDDGTSHIAETGITPAYAGKSPNASCAEMAETDHPRVCGEKLVTALTRYSRWGSPPRMRGKDGQAELVADPLGITPAHAGKRLCVLFLVTTI